MILIACLQDGLKVDLVWHPAWAFCYQDTLTHTISINTRKLLNIYLNNSQVSCPTYFYLFHYVEDKKGPWKISIDNLNRSGKVEYFNRQLGQISKKAIASFIWLFKQISKKSIAILDKSTISMDKLNRSVKSQIPIIIAK